ncbi:MAG TPA: hypothetical protein VMV97_08395 [Sulfuriferula sp.]|nr:hypothetical protein [Sulfuriferula sp.]
MLLSWYDRDRDFESPQHSLSNCIVNQRAVFSSKQRELYTNRANAKLDYMRVVQFFHGA